jgi:hypothetical protein
VFQSTLSKAFFEHIFQLPCLLRLALRLARFCVSRKSPSYALPPLMYLLTKFRFINIKFILEAVLCVFIFFTIVILARTWTWPWGQILRTPRLIGYCGCRRRSWRRRLWRQRRWMSYELWTSVVWW